MYLRSCIIKCIKLLYKIYFLRIKSLLFYNKNFHLIVDFTSILRCATRGPEIW